MSLHPLVTEDILNNVWLLHSHFHPITRDMTYVSPLIRPTFLHMPWTRVLLEKLTTSQLVEKFLAFYGTWRFITTFTSTCHIPHSNLPLINSSNSGTCYCKQHLSEWIGEEAEHREQAAITYGIESAVETCLYGTCICKASQVPHGWKWCPLRLSGLENYIQAGLVLHAFAFTWLENSHHFSNLHIIFSFTWYGIDNTW